VCRKRVESVSGHDMLRPVLEMTCLHYERLIKEGYADEDISALYRLKQQLFDKRDD